jgi:hypothetical protein
MLKVSEIAKMYGVTTPAVRLWLKDGLKHDFEQEVGYRICIVIDPKDVDDYHKSKLEQKKKKA